MFRFQNNTSTTEGALRDDSDSRDTSNGNESDALYHLEVSFDEAIAGKEVEISRDQLQAGLESPNSNGSRKFPWGSGSRLVMNEPTLRVKVPAGIDQGDRIRLRGKGYTDANGGPPGDLYVQVRVKPHPIFRRDNDDLHCEVPVSFATAEKGGVINIPTLERVEKLAVPPRTEAGRIFRLCEQGIKGVRSSKRGDLFCHIRLFHEVHFHATPQSGDVPAFIDKLLLAYDTLHMAISSESMPDAHRDGLLVADRQFRAGLALAGAEIIDPIGQRFDPLAHEALLQLPPAEAEQSGTVESVRRLGLRFNGRLIRPAHVIVYK